MNRTLNILKCLLLMVMVGALIVPSATAITDISYNLPDRRAGEVSIHDAEFKLQANLVKDGKIKILFPVGFNISAATNQTDPENDGGWDDGKYTFIRDVSSRTLIFQRDGSGEDYQVGDYINFQLGDIVNPNKGNYIITIYTTMSNDQPTPDVGSASVTITNGPATRLTFETITDPQMAGTAFPITVNALDQFGNIDTGYNEDADLSSSIGTISPDFIEIIGGTGEVDVELTITGNVVNITARDPSVPTINGTSNDFKVNPAALDSIEIAHISNQFDELAFTVTAQAKDEYGNNKTDYNSVNNLTVNPGKPNTVTIVSPDPATVQFVNGTFSGQVKLNVTPNPTPNALQTGVSLTIRNATLGISGTSNDFSISLPVDLKNSSVVANPTRVIENGISKSTITVTVKNGINQQNISGAIVVLTSSGVGTIIPDENTTDSNGQAQFTIDSTAPGTAELTATVWGTEILEQKPVVTFGFDELLHLSKGWNLVSVPRILDNSSVSALNTNKVDMIHYYDAGIRDWKSAYYTNGSWSGTLKTIDDGKGYWMNATEPADVSAVLKPLNDPMQFPPSYQLKAGWNMVGYTSYTSVELKTDASDYFFSLWNPISGFPIWVSAYKWTGSGYELTKPTGGFPYVVRTEGYWLYLNSDGTLVP